MVQLYGWLSGMEINKTNNDKNIYLLALTATNSVQIVYNLQFVFNNSDGLCWAYTICLCVCVSVNVNLSFHQVQQFHRLCNGFFCRAAVFFLCLSLQCYCRVSSVFFSTIFPIFLYRGLLSKSVLCIHFFLFKDVNRHRKQHQHNHNTSSHNTNNVHFDYFQSSSCQST